MIAFLGGMPATAMIPFSRNRNGNDTDVVFAYIEEPPNFGVDAVPTDYQRITSESAGSVVQYG